MKEFYGIKDIEFIWNGQYSDPEIKYKGVTFNYWDVENALYYNYLMDHKDRPDLCHAEDDDFAAWLQANPDEAYNLLNDLIWAKGNAA